MVDLAWDIGQEKAPDLPPKTVILNLAGRTAGRPDELAKNVLAARAVAALARDLDGVVLHMSSAAVYAPGPQDLHETDEPAPPSDYGRAKLAAERAMDDAMPEGRLCLLRLANLAGGDMLFRNIRDDLPISLDPIEGQTGGPLRSYIGPVTLGRVLDGLIVRLSRGQALPRVLNLAQPGALAMAEILQAAGARWSWGQPRAAAIPRVTLSTARLAGLVSLPPATPDSLVAELAALTRGVK